MLLIPVGMTRLWYSLCGLHHQLAVDQFSLGNDTSVASYNSYKIYVSDTHLSTPLASIGLIKLLVVLLKVLIYVCTYVNANVID